MDASPVLAGPEPVSAPVPSKTLNGYSSKDRDRDRDRERERDRDRDRDRRRSKERSKHRDDKSRSRSDRDRDKEKDKDKRSGHKSERRDRSRDKDKDKEKEKEREREREKRREKDKDRHRSGKDKEREKDRDRERHKDKSSSSHRSRKDEAPKAAVKAEREPSPVVAAAATTALAPAPAPAEETPQRNNGDVSDGAAPPVKMEPEAESEDDVPLNVRKKAKRKALDSDEEETPLSARKAPKKKKMKIKKEPACESEEDSPRKKTSKPAKVKREPSANDAGAPPKRKKKQEEEQEVWKWWEEKRDNGNTKWTFLEHRGPLFAPPYERLPPGVVFRYDGKETPLSEDAEEVAGFYARMLDHDYTSKAAFNDNFFADWRKAMTDREKALIKDLKKCDFKQMHAYFSEQAEKNRNKSKEEKAALKAKNEELQKEYGFCTIDGHKEKIGNFRIEPPGLFRGRGEHPKMGMLKKRVLPEHVTVNCSASSAAPKPPPGRKWKEVRHDNTVTWLASWTENVQGQVKYVMLNPSSKLKGEKDWQKYETARKLAGCVESIRATYKEEWKAKEMRIRQRAVALYFIDRLALRAGNEKDDDQADTVGCCSLRVEHIELHKEKDGREHVVVFDFLGKDSIRYYNEVPVEKRVFKNLELFKENKKTGDDLFDRLNTQIMNEHLKDLMPNLTAKVFRTFNASFTLQNQLDELTDSDASVEEKILAYNRANRAVAVLCNHQRAVPKGHQKSMDALKEKIQAKRDLLDEAESELRDARKAARKGSVKEKLNADKKEKALQRLREQLRKLEVQETDRDENKTIALGTSKLNYLDPRISVAWCKKNNVPIEKIYNKTQRDKFRWAIDMATEDYVF